MEALQITKKWQPGSDQANKDYFDIKLASQARIL
jgi:hypothetical protein